MEFRNQLLKTAEIAGSTVTWFGKSHYLLANVALVGEAIALAMRTSASLTSLTKTKICPASRRGGVGIGMYEG